MLRQLLEAPPSDLAAALPRGWREPPSADIAGLCARINALALRTGTVADPDPPLDGEVLSQLFTSGLLSLTVPAEFGGWSAGLRDFCSAMESVGHLGPAYAMTAVPHLCISVKSVAGLCPPVVAEPILRAIRERQQLLAFAITEDQGSDLAAMKTRVRRAADGSLRLTGRKQWITNLSRASHVVVCALCPELHPAPGATVLALVALGQRGVTVSPPWLKHCANGSDTAEIYFDEVEIAAGHLLGQPGQGMRLFNEMVLPGRLGAAAAAVGMAREALRCATVDPAGPLSTRRIVELDAMLDALSGCLRLCAALGDADHPEFPLVNALVKHLCPREAQIIAAAIDHAYAARQRPSPSAVERACRAMGLFRLLKGPGEIVALQAVAACTGRIGTAPLPPAWPRPIRLGLQLLRQGFADLGAAGGPSANPLGAAALADAAAGWWLVFATELAARAADDPATSARRRLGRRWAWQRFAAPARQYVWLRPVSAAVVDDLYATVCEAARTGPLSQANLGEAVWR